ncbi:hypothetical protein RB653_005210 [Dictyostelium firmibasis]|uniref:Eukaryotic translation initiation factor 4E n=1 Tax=Dictyostelium firmibasis TaxID=79012 RepID=A0AAN7Z0V0_9MYCE
MNQQGLSYTDQMEIQAKSNQTPPVHQLDATWTLFTDKKQYQSNTATSHEDYLSTLTNIGSFSSVEDFWGYYHKLQRPSKMQADTTYHLFKSGISPTWEDPENIKGGKWVINFQKSTRFIFNVDLIWEDIVLGVVGETIDIDRDICGVVLSKRDQAERIAIWNKDCSNEKNIEQLKLNIMNTIAQGCQGADLNKLNIRYQSHSTFSSHNNTTPTITPSSSSTSLSSLAGSTNSTSTPFYKSNSNSSSNNLNLLANSGNNVNTTQPQSSTLPNSTSKSDNLNNSGSNSLSSSNENISITENTSKAN